MSNAEIVARSLAAVWHPCTQMKSHERFPLVPVRRAEGPWLEDFDGRHFSTLLFLAMPNSSPARRVSTSCPGRAL